MGYAIWLSVAFAFVADCGEGRKNPTLERLSRR
jgi:hypothetical protein